MERTMDTADGLIVQSILHGNGYDFSRIYIQYKRLVYAEALKFFGDFNDIEDTCQEVFLRVFKSLALFNPEYRLSTWITTITKNLCLSKIKKQRHYSSGSMDELNMNGHILSNSVTPEMIVVDKESSDIVHSTVMELPEIYREPVILFYYEGLPYTQLAATLNVPMTIVKNRLYRAKIMLKVKLSSCCNK